LEVGFRSRRELAGLIETLQALLVNFDDPHAHVHCGDRRRRGPGGTLTDTEIFFFAGECMPDNRMCVQPDTPGRCGQRNGCGVVIDAVL